MHQGSGEQWLFEENRSGQRDSYIAGPMPYKEVDYTIFKRCVDLGSLSFHAIQDL